MTGSPFTFEIVRDNLYAISEEMAADLQAIAYSPIIREAGDFTTGFTDSSGQLLAQASRLNTPGHYNSIPSATKAVFKKFGLNGIAPGDVFVTNDPWVCAGHLPDIFVFSPIFYEDRLQAFAVSGAHHIDVGGRSPGSTTADGTEIFQEGLQLPTLKLADRGSTVSQLLDVIAANVRLPAVVLNDLNAQMAVLRRGSERLQELCQKYGVEEVTSGFRQAIELAEAQTRRAIEALPDGSWEWTTQVDDDGQSGDPIIIRAQVVIEGSGLTVDYSGSSRQVRGGMNLTPPFRDAYTHVAIRQYFPEDIPHNEGVLRPISITAPLGSVLNPERPAAVAGRAPVVSRMVDALVACLSQAVPSKAMAGYGGTLAQPVWSGKDSVTGQRFIFMDTTHGGLGGRRGLDGESCISFPFDVGNHPAEYLEMHYPVKVRRLALRENSEGAGKFRGGFGAEKTYELLADGVEIAVVGDRLVFPPFGLEGGGEGARLEHLLVRDSQELRLGSKVYLSLKKGDQLTIRTAGGGGLEPATARDPAAVAQDVRNGLVSCQRAKAVYRVVCDVHGKLSERATRHLRSRRDV